MPEDQYSAGTADAGDPASNARGGRISGREERLDAGRGKIKDVAATKWGTKRYLQMNRLAELVAIA